MWPRSARFDRFIRGVHQPVTRVDVLEVGEVVDTASLAGLVVDGQVTVERATVRRRLTLTIADPTGQLRPDEVTDLLTPYGRELRVWSGIAYPDGEELLPVGTFTPVVVVAQAGEVRVEGYDRAWRVQRNVPEQPLVIPAGTNVAAAIGDLVAGRLAPLPLDADLTATVETTPLVLIDAGEDPWQAAQDLAATIGCQLYFDAFGRLVLADEPDLASQPADWTYGPEEAMHLTVEETLSAEDTSNVVVVHGQAADGTPPVRGVAEDTDPASPTRVDGPFGRRVHVETSELVTSQAMAQAMARTLLQRQIGLSEQLSWQAIPHPAHDVGDVLRVEQDGRTWLVVLDQLTLPLGQGGLASLTARARRVVLA